MITVDDEQTNEAAANQTWVAAPESAVGPPDAGATASSASEAAVEPNECRVPLDAQRNYCGPDDAIEAPASEPAAARAPDPEAVRLAQQIEQLGGPSYDVRDMSRAELLAKYAEVVARTRPPQDVSTGGPTAGQTPPDEALERRTINYLDPTTGRVRSKSVLGTRAQNEAAEQQEARTIAQKMGNGVLKAAAGVGAPVTAPANAQAPGAPVQQEPW